MVRVAIFAYVLLAGLATPALLFASGDNRAATAQSSGAPGADPPASSAGTTTATQPAPPPTAAVTPAPSPATAESDAPTPTPQRVTVQTAARTGQPRAVAHAASSDTIVDFKFTPSTVTVTAGQSVTWSNQGPTGHSATSDNGAFDTGVLKKGQSGSHTFTKPGTYPFHCLPHPFMKGKVIVVAASAGGGSASGSAGGGSSAGGSGNTGSSGSSSGTGTSATGSDTSSGSGSSSSLPNTGADTGAVALLGAILLGGGTVLRRRAAGR